ncbi:MAG: DNA recombination protein RmuC [Subdoligranulum variabile]|uniref:DNA recombination protein RmuC n=1 Tax=Gemmiger sp. TaxID=2049027 RepID=UPI002A8E0191|nr:DNA recombination protein RmuC [Gemmiger sp.]MCI6383848.1 DNA recombination protein RmuC [Subdoligranulum variabile]MDY5083157.1 DNA recombination protein RmuC [Candidatus Limivicinus sp.]MDD6424919.1 DNA recombination protein RmuC [Subdoligranulum variabile]MDD6648780.1 DNA recombination protein RmuC [Subdoligranulum variabile]MDD7640842.1 DNA recombination protein RmuC [Subdoligranulum variabile]
MEILLYLVLALALMGDVLLAVLLVRSNRPQKQADTADDFVRAMTPVLQSETDLLAEQLRAMQGESARTTTATLRDFSAVLSENQRQTAAASTARLESIDRAGAARQKAANDALIAQLTMMETRLKNLEDSNAARLDGVRGALVQGLNTIRADNNQKLDEIRGTVEEKLQDTLQKRINESFRTVSNQLEQVYKGLGEMQNLAADVGSLKQVLSGVKTRGILGEVQLGAILEQILAPGQYAENVATVPGSANRVEFAIKMPGQNGNIWLPIDAKFPGDTYAHLQAALERGDAAAAAAMRKALQTVLRQEAKDIHDKYIEVPYTTSFGILFLPFEGLYAEVVSSGITEALQRDYQITVAGPSTMAALLNALQMGFRTLAIQKRSGEVWTILGAVKTEFEKFGAGLQQMQRHLNQTGSDLEELIGPRSRAITRKLESVQQLDPDTAADLLGIEETTTPV